MSRGIGDTSKIELGRKRPFGCIGRIEIWM
jgi:hypothetical protein